MSEQREREKEREREEREREREREQLSNSDTHSREKGNEATSRVEETKNETANVARKRVYDSFESAQLACKQVLKFGLRWVVLNRFNYNLISKFSSPLLVWPSKEIEKLLKGFKIASKALS